MKPILRTPFFEFGVKNYIYGDDVLRIAEAADIAAARYDIDVLMIVPYTEIRRIAENTARLVILAPYMDLLSPGRGMADVLPEALKAAGARGAVVNHCERPMTLSAVKRTIDRARELGMLSFACSDSIAEARALAQLGPDIINPEPSELIGSGTPSGPAFVREVTAAVKHIDDTILVEQAAGISSGKQVYDLILAGAEGCGASSGIFLSDDPRRMVEEMIRSVRMARDDRAQAMKKQGAS